MQLLLERNDKTQFDLEQANCSLSLDLQKMKESMEYYKREMLEKEQRRNDKSIVELKKKLDYSGKLGKETEDSDYDAKGSMKEKSKSSKNRIIQKEKLQTCNSYRKLQAKNNKLQQKFDYLQERINNDFEHQI